MWSLENEALATAVLEKVSTGLRASQSPIHVPMQRKTRLDALASLYACSVEGRQARPYDHLPAQERISLSALFESTRLRKCFGWIEFRGKDLMHLNRRIRFGGFCPEKGDLAPLRFEPEKQYFGIVYEFIPAATREAPAMQRQIDFFHYAGFDTSQPANLDNWQGPGIKLDLGDFVTAIDPRLDGESYFETPTTARYILGHRNTIDVDDDTFMDEIEEAQRQARVPRARARAVERAFCAPYYAGDKRHRHPSQVSTRLPEDALTAVRVPEIEPPVVRKAWRAYRKQKLAYLAALREAKKATAKTKAEDEIQNE
jgi:hypothetical protein